MTIADFESLYKEYLAESQISTQHSAFTMKSNAITSAMDKLLNLSANEHPSETGLSHLYTYYKCIGDLSLNLDSSIKRMYKSHDNAIRITNNMLSFLNQLIAVAGKNFPDAQLGTLVFNAVPSGIEPPTSLKGLLVSLDEGRKIVDSVAGATMFGVDSFKTAKTTAGKVGASLFTIVGGGLTAIAAYGEMKRRNEEIRKSFEEISAAIDKECKLIKKKIKYANKGFEKISLLQTAQKLFFTFFTSGNISSFIAILSDQGTLNKENFDSLTLFIEKMNNSLSAIASKQYSQKKETVSSKNTPSFDYLARTTGSDSDDATAIPKKLDKILTDYLPDTLTEANKSVDERRWEKIREEALWTIIFIVAIVVLILLIRFLWPVFSFIFSILGTIFNIAISIIKSIWYVVKAIFSFIDGLFS